MIIDKLSFSVAAIEFEKVYMVMDKCISLGYNARILSFLLGYRATYVRDVEDPMQKLRYTPKDTNYLQSIFECRLPEIMPGKIAELHYQIKIDTSIDADGHTVYEISRELKNQQYILYRKIKLADRPIAVSNKVVEVDKILEYVRHLFSSGYFDAPKTALEVFNKCRKKFSLSVHPDHVAKGIAFYTGKRKSPRLIQEKNESSRTVYTKC